MWVLAVRFRRKNEMIFISVGNYGLKGIKTS